MIDGLIRDLDHALHGPARTKRRLIEEARAGLLDAADAYASAGFDRADATRRAVAEFGTVAELAPVYQAELDITRLRVTAIALLVVLSVLAPFANLAWDHNPQTMPNMPGLIPLIGKMLVAVTFATSLTAIVVLLGTSRARVDRVPGWGPRALQLTGHCGLLALTFGLVTLADTAPGVLRWPPFLATVVLAVMTFFVVAIRHQGATRRLG
ncbi:permease prefix domain 1-containing protein [Amycolatopsis taiwanensis]|uniref:permease prefix domain 1-containing protein n=1 Tax=Amycolatopsis taiwanensis TaxID=342230 RepID=UPI0004B46986|nr:permease prefix domain 1-containing protein [Amycolatopsis taiwanensis]